MTTESETIDRLARIETNIERIASVLEDVTKDHETRLRKVEEKQAHLDGIVKLLTFIGAPGVAAIVVFLATKS